MSPTLHHECTRVPVTAVASCGALVLAAEGPLIRFYHASDFHFISSQHIFESQTVHGITVCFEHNDNLVRFIIWGGRHMRALEVRYSIQQSKTEALEVSLSNVVKAPDWLFDLAARPSSSDEGEHCDGICAAVTAHNALLQVKIVTENKNRLLRSSRTVLSISELTTSTRSLLYSAHLVWDSPTRLLIAAGTAFGEIIYWSWSQDGEDVPFLRTRRIFTGHEGSIFGVRISQKLRYNCPHHLRRAIASCSDDRTIRIWDISDVVDSEDSAKDDGVLEALRTRHTGFSNESFDARPFTSSECLAIGWGHGSRIWTIQFLENSSCSGSVFLKSTGEDATARTWELAPSKGCGDNRVYGLTQLDCAGYHSGKNIWATDTIPNSQTMSYAIYGGADSKITASPLPQSAQATKMMTRRVIAEYTIDDVLGLAERTIKESRLVAAPDHHKSSKHAEFFRSYCFIDASTIMLTTNSGKVLLESLHDITNLDTSSLLAKSACIAHLDELSGYSVCIHGSVSGLAFLAGAKGSIFMYRIGSPTLTKVYSITGKVGAMFTAVISGSSGQEKIAILITVVGQKEAQLLYVDMTGDPQVTRIVTIPLSELESGSIITTMAHVSLGRQEFAFVGLRRGTIAVYKSSEKIPHANQASLHGIIKEAHADETVTHLEWVSLPKDHLVGHLISTGRDGRLVIHRIDLSTNSIELVSRLTMPFGPNIEGLYFLDDHLMVHGFSSRKWILYDVTAEDEVMAVDTGGAHRGWAYRPFPSTFGGSIVWTRASSMHICSQAGSNHKVIRPGGHGREIKAVAVSPTRNSDSCSPLIATGAEDTDIKLFQYIDGDLKCIRTLRQHTTGIQHLQWSEDGNYLFSSGGCEEFYIWRVRDLPSNLGVGIVCEHIYTPESEHADLRLMSFDVRTLGSTYDIAMVFSDSSIKVYRFTPASSLEFQALARGTYFTSCLTQCVFLSTTSILTVSTDGHAVVWPKRSTTNGHCMEASGSPSAITWDHPMRIHQNSSKAMATYQIIHDSMLVVSGGDDGSVALLLASTKAASSTNITACTSPPVIVRRTHGSAVTACAIIAHGVRTFILTAGNDEWLRLWEIKISTTIQGPSEDEILDYRHQMEVYRLRKAKTNVADVSSMAVLDTSDQSARVLLCGVGMEIIRLEWEL